MDLSYPCRQHLQRVQTLQTSAYNELQQLNQKNANIDHDRKVAEQTFGTIIAKTEQLKQEIVALKTSCHHKASSLLRLNERILNDRKKMNDLNERQHVLDTSQQNVDDEIEQKKYEHVILLKNTQRSTLAYQSSKKNLDDSRHELIELEVQYKNQHSQMMKQQSSLKTHKLGLQILKNKKNVVADKMLQIQQNAPLPLEDSKVLKTSVKLLGSSKVSKGSKKGSKVSNGSKASKANIKTTKKRRRRRRHGGTGVDLDGHALKVQRTDLFGRL